VTRRRLGPADGPATANLPERPREAEGCPKVVRQSIDAAACISGLEMLRSVASPAANPLPEMAPNPDAELLEQADELLAWLKRRNAALDEMRSSALVSSASWEKSKGAYLEACGVISSRLRAMGKLRARTPAGIYAKALLVRGSQSGAAGLLASLANDLIDSPELRAALWPVGSEAGGERRPASFADPVRP